MEITQFGLKNFRVFKEHYDFDLAPIMVLTGPNNSGKSSLSKALLLLQANEANINKDLHWTARLNYILGEHDLGNHKLTVNKKDENTIFTFTFFREYKFAVVIDYKGDFTADYSIYSGDNELIISQSGAKFSADVNLLVQYFYDRVSVANSEHSKIDLKKIKRFIKKLKDFSERFWGINIDILTDYDFQNGAHVYDNEKEAIKRIKEGLEKGILTTLPYSNDSESPGIEDQELQQLLIFLLKKITSINLSTEEIHFLIPTSVNEYSAGCTFLKFSDLIYINTLKEPFKRLYARNDVSAFQSFIINEINSKSEEIIYDGSIYSHSIKVADEKEYFILDNREEFETFIRKWLLNFEIGNEISYGYDEPNNAFFIKINDNYLPEYGLGYGLIIHILLALSNEIHKDPLRNEKPLPLKFPSTNNEIRNNALNELQLIFPPTYIIEEPETGLHPAFQAKMAEMIVDIQKTFGVNLIIETHSEYFIRKLQYLTATNEIKPGDAVIYYFNNPKKIPEGEEQIKKITIEKNGSLTDTFGPGFIDEGTNLKFDLIKLNKSRNN